MMRLVDTTDEIVAGSLPKQHVEVKHPVIVGFTICDRDRPAWQSVGSTVFATIVWSLQDFLNDNGSMLPRLNDLLICVVNGAKGQ
jgi:hypothetical protein